MRIRKWKIKKLIDKIMHGIKKTVEKLNWHYIALAVIILFGIGLLFASYCIVNSDMKNIAVGLGTGIVTSALVTLYIEIINTKIERKKMIRYKKLLLNPLYNAIKSLYVQLSLCINEYRVREEKGNILLLPMEDTKELSDFLNEMKKIDVESIEDEKQRERTKEFSSVSLIYFREVVSQYEGLAFESMILDNIISQKEYDQLKHFTLLNECKKCLGLLNDKTQPENDKYCTRVQLMHCMMLFINRLMKTFDFLALKIETENSWIKKHLDDIYYNEIYVFSDAYVEQCAVREEEKAEYYAEHPELLEEIEESEEDKLYRKINEAIWSGDAETIKECFPMIDKNNKQIQSELTWDVAKTVMKDKELRDLYYQKYGMKYKVRKEKRRRKGNRKR